MRLSVHGFVLAGGQSARMGRDKALLPFLGQPMVARAVATLSAVCSQVSIAGNRDDLTAFAPVVHEARHAQGPVAGIEAGLLACQYPWALFMPVDLPLLPAAFVHAWGQAVVARPGVRASYVTSGADPHPALCLLARDCVVEVSQAIDGGTRRVRDLLEAVRGLWVADVSSFAERAVAARWLSNVNTPDELDKAQRT